MVYSANINKGCVLWISFCVFSTVYVTPPKIRESHYIKHIQRQAQGRRHIQYSMRGILIQRLYSHRFNSVKCQHNRMLFRQVLLNFVLMLRWLRQHQAQGQALCGDRVVCHNCVHTSCDSLKACLIEVIAILVIVAAFSFEIKNLLFFFLITGFLFILIHAAHHLFWDCVSVPTLSYCRSDPCR